MSFFKYKKLSRSKLSDHRVIMIHISMHATNHNSKTLKRRIALNSGHRPNRFWHQHQPARYQKLEYYCRIFPLGGGHVASWAAASHQLSSITSVKKLIVSIFQRAVFCPRRDEAVVFVIMQKAPLIQYAKSIKLQHSLFASVNKIFILSSPSIIRPVRLCLPRRSHAPQYINGNDLSRDSLNLLS